MERKTFVKLDLPGGKTAFLMTSLINEGKDGFKLTLNNGDNIWTGQVTEDDMDVLRIKMKMDLGTFVKQTAEAFTKEDVGDVVYQYLVHHVKRDSSVEFVWKKHVPAEDITFQLGSTILQQCASTKEQMCKMLEFCVDNTKKLEDRIHTLETDNERLSQERVNSLKRLEKCVVAKEELEKDLYSKFVAVLNTKKEKIRQLKDQVSSGTASYVRQDSESEDEPVASTSGRSLKSSAVESRKKEGKRTNDSDAETTDEETKPTQNKRARTKASSKITTLDADDSLVLDESMDDDRKDTSTIISRPRRHGGNKKQTPSKPVLPKVTSKGSAQSSSSTSRRSSMRKSNSGSHRSPDNEDADDLLAELM